MTVVKCPVCRASEPGHFTRIDERDYYACAVCEARFLGPADYPSPVEERAHYELHENNLFDVGYRKFLSKLSLPLLEKLSPGLSGLDYGCGPGPALAEMMREAGHRMALYDPFFHPDPAPLNETYDFITCSETVEHFHQPADEFARLDTMLRPGGWLAVMTCFQTDDARFKGWHYRKDPTHVVFYRPATFQVIAAAHGWSLEIPVKDVVLMRQSYAC